MWKHTWSLCMLLGLAIPPDDMEYILASDRRTLYSVQCTVDSVQGTVYTFTKQQINGPLGEVCWYPKNNFQQDSFGLRPVGVPSNIQQSFCSTSVDIEIWIKYPNWIFNLLNLILLKTAVALSAKKAFFFLIILWTSCKIETFLKKRNHFWGLRFPYK